MSKSEPTIYDLIIIGGGPAGLSAAIYAARYRLNFIVLATDYQNKILAKHKIANYPATGEIEAGDLWEKMRQQAVDLGSNLVKAKVLEINEMASGFEVKTGMEENREEGGDFSTNSFLTKKIILATGAQRNKPGLENEDKFLGHGLSYCSACDAPFYRDLSVAVVGGGNSALTAAAHLAEFAQKVFLIHRGMELNGEPALREKIQTNQKIEIRLNTKVTALHGEENLSSISLDQGVLGEIELKLDGIFFEIGSTPETEFLSNLDLKFDAKNKIMVGRDQKTNLTGIWAAGDLTDGSNNLKQIITACAEGAVASADVFTALKSQK